MTMTTEELRAIAKQEMPQIKVETVAGSYRWNVIDSLPGNRHIGIELGVAGGSFSARMMRSGKFKRFYGVDIYGDGHTVVEYKKALRSVGLNRNFHLLRMTFDQALDLFPDQFFDFIYADGYAHTGEEGGQTLLNWYAKLKPGGVMAGDDYDPEAWPLVVWAVHNLADQLGVDLKITDLTVDETYNRYRSWYFTKPEGPEPELRPSPLLVQFGNQEKAARAEKNKEKIAAKRARHGSS